MATRHSHSRSKLPYLVIPAQSLPRTAIRGRNPADVCGETWFPAFGGMSVIDTLKRKWSERAAAYDARRPSNERNHAMRLSTIMAVLLIGTVLYIIMAVIRAAAIGRMEGMQDEALDYRRKAVRAGIFGAVLLLVAYVMDWW